MGKCHDDLFDPAVARLTAAYLGALMLDAEAACPLLWEDRPEGMDQAEFDRRVGALCAAPADPAAGHAAQVAIVAEAIDELCERLDLVEAREGRDRELALREASFDASPAGAARLRYEMSHERTLRASLRDLRALQKGRPAPVEAGTSRAVDRGATTTPGAVAVAPTEPNAIALAPTEAKATAVETAVAPTEPTADAVAPTEAMAGTTRPVLTSETEEVGTPGGPIADPIWPPSTAGGIGHSFAEAT